MEGRSPCPIVPNIGRETGCNSTPALSLMAFISIYKSQLNADLVISFPPTYSSHLSQCLVAGVLRMKPLPQFHLDGNC